VKSWQIEAAIWFFRMGLQYYSAGRFSFFERCFPVAGSLLHHAVEMILKGYLSRKLSQKELKALGHSLVNLWTKFKSDFKDRNLDKMDNSIHELDKFEKIRYPDAIISDGMFFGFTPSGAAPKPIGSTVEPVYNLTLEDIDRLVQTIFTKSKENPEFYTHLLGVEAHKILKRENHWPLKF
jgi:hypothetical protein